MKIAKVCDINFEVPKEVWYSFFNSPYIGHRLGTAIDVYYSERALFPFEEGKIKEVKKIRTPRYVPVDVDYLTIVEVKDFCLKILHVKTSVKVGEQLYLGDEIGEMIVSGFFSPWSDNHTHFELRDCNDRYRARGAFLIIPETLQLVPSVKGNEFEVIEKREHYYWLTTLKRGKKNLTPLTYQNVSIEGGLSHYHHGAIFGDFDKVELFGKAIPVKEKLSNDAGIFETNFEVFANGQKVRGIGVYCNQKIKLIGGEFREGDIVELRFV